MPEVVKWTYRGKVFDLLIEFEDETLLAEGANGTDVDMHEGDDSAGAKETTVDDTGRQLSKGPGSGSTTTEDGAVPVSSVPTTTLRFGAFEPASARGRTWATMPALIVLTRFL